MRIDFRLIPLLKGLRIGEIVSQLVECHDLTLNPEDPGDVRNIYKTSRTIITDDYGLDEENQLEIIDEAAEGYQFSRDLKLPKTLTYCLQDVDTKGIKVKHKLRFRVQLHNPDGHVSEVSSLPQSGWVNETNYSHLATCYTTGVGLHISQPPYRREQHPDR